MAPREVAHAFKSPGGFTNTRIRAATVQTITRQEYVPPIDERLRWDSNLRVYNSLDVTVDQELYEVLAKQMDEHSQRLYRYTRSMNAVAIQMMLRGVRVGLPCCRPC